MTEQQMQELVSLINGHGDHSNGGWLTGGPFHTYTGLATTDPVQTELHHACLELEKRGLISREAADHFHMVWRKPTVQEMADRAESIQQAVSQVLHEPIKTTEAATNAGQSVSGTGSDAVDSTQGEGSGGPDGAGGAPTQSASPRA